MSKAESGQQPKFEIDAVLKEQEETVAKAKKALADKIVSDAAKDEVSDVPFRAVGYTEVKLFTSEVKNNPEASEQLDGLKESALRLVIVGKDGEIIPKGEQYYPRSRNVVVGVHNAFASNNASTRMNTLNDVLSHVLSTNPDGFGENAADLKRKTISIQQRFAFIQDKYGKSSKAK